MVRGRGVADPRPLGDLPQGKRLDSAFGKFGLGRVDECRAKIAVMVFLVVGHFRRLSGHLDGVKILLDRLASLAHLVSVKMKGAKMTPDTLFALSGPLAMLGWAALLLSPLAPRPALMIAGTVIPLVLSVAYAGLILAFWSGSDGGFGSLADVAALFANPWLLLAGWLHYLCFDLFVGAWITRTARAEGVPHGFVIPCLLLTFLFGPAGYFGFCVLRLVRARLILAA